MGKQGRGPPANPWAPALRLGARWGHSGLRASLGRSLAHGQGAKPRGPWGPPPSGASQGRLTNGRAPFGPSGHWQGRPSPDAASALGGIPPLAPFGRLDEKLPRASIGRRGKAPAGVGKPGKAREGAAGPAGRGRAEAHGLSGGNPNPCHGKQAQGGMPMAWLAIDQIIPPQKPPRFSHGVSGGAAIRLS
jgi:hypothetical protein